MCNAELEYRMQLGEESQRTRSKAKSKKSQEGPA